MNFSLKRVFLKSQFTELNPVKFSNRDVARIVFQPGTFYKKKLG